MSIEYGIRYREPPPWRGRGDGQVRPVSDGSVEAAEYAAHGLMAIGFCGIQIVKRRPGGEWELHRKVNPGREIARKLTGRETLVQCIAPGCEYVEWVTAVPPACPLRPGDGRHAVKSVDPSSVAERYLRRR
jgi:hypothetical protein